jgi:hypothetical protein
VDSLVLLFESRKKISSVISLNSDKKSLIEIGMEVKSSSFASIAET